MGLICTLGSIPTFEIRCLSNTEATNRWHEFHENLLLPGCLVTFIGEWGDAVEYRCHSASVHYEVARAFAFDHHAEAFPNQELVGMMVSGRCFQPGCRDYGQRVEVCSVFESHE